MYLSLVGNNVRDHCSFTDIPICDNVRNIDIVKSMPYCTISRATSLKYYYYSYNYYNHGKITINTVSN